MKADPFTFAEVAFRSEVVWLMASKPAGKVGPVTALGVFPSMRVAHNYMEFIREHHNDEEYVAGCDLFVQAYRPSDRKKG